MSKVLVIPVDTGNRGMKTKNHYFPASYVVSSYLPAIGSDILKYDGIEYTLDDQPMTQLDDKTKGIRYFILTLFAIGKELKDMDLKMYETTEGIINVILLLGTPPLHCKEAVAKYKEYFTNGGNPISFEINKKPVTIKITDVKVYPQAYAAALTVREEIKNTRIVNVVDIGGYTVDGFQMTDFRVDISTCKSLYSGINILFETINEQVRAKMAKEIPYFKIEGVLRNDQEIITNMKAERISVIKTTTERFAKDLLSKLTHAGFDLEENPTVFVGGGSILLQPYIEGSGMIEKPIFSDNVQANVDGYQLMYSAQNPDNQ